jgi:hypothetical protein
MKNLISMLALSLVASAALAAKTYQVTGPVLEVTDKNVVVQKGKEKWEIARDAIKATEVKVGDKVTIEYEMVAKTVEVKTATAKKK